MPIVEVPGHGQVEFPDSMTDDQIVSAIKTNLMPKTDPNAIGGVGAEIGRSVSDNLDTIKAAGPSGDLQRKVGIGGVVDVGKAIAAIPGLLAAPVTGTARSLIGRAYDAVSPLTPEQRQQYGLESGRDVADKAMMGISPRGIGPTGPRIGPKPVPSAESLRAAADAAYNSPDVTNLRINPQRASDFVAQTRREMLNQKVDPIAAPTVDKILGNLEQPRFGQAHTVDDFDLVRQSLKLAPFNEGRAAGIVRKQIDDYLGNIPTGDVLSGDAVAANQQLTNARGNYAAMKRDEQIASALGRAENQAGSTYSGNSNLTNQTRQQLRPILNEKSGVALKKKTFQDYTPEEIEQIRKAVNGTLVGNAARIIEKEIKKPPIPFLGRLAAAPFKMVEDASTARQAGLLGEMLRSRSPLAQSLAPAPLPAPNPFLAAPASGISLAELLSGLRAYPAMVPSRADQQQR